MRVVKNLFRMGLGQFSLILIFGIHFSFFFVLSLFSNFTLPAMGPGAGATPLDVH
jgi:hypothetical protein